MTSVIVGWAPFNDPKGDIILRSADHVNFHVFKYLLSLSSNFSKCMFELPQPVPEDSSTAIPSVPVVEMSECSQALDIALRVLYPTILTGVLKFRSVGQIVGLVEFTQKYGIENGESIIKDALTLLEDSPFAVFAITCRCKMGKEARNAAKHCLRRPLVPDEILELKYLTITDLIKFQRYHVRCAKDLERLGLADFGWTWGSPSGALEKMITTQCSICGR